MADYEKMYTRAFNAMTDAQRLIKQARELIEAAQRECEDIYIESGEDEEM